MLLYLIKHSRPDLENAIRESSKVMDGANKISFLEMHQVFKYSLDTANLGLKIKPSRDKK